MYHFDMDRDWLMQCDLPSERWKIRRKRTGVEKRIMKLYREQLYLWQVISSMEYEDLEIPVKKGYKRHFELREELSGNKNADLFEGILKKINTVQYSKDKQFKKIRSRRLGKYKYRKKGIPTLLDLTEKQFNELGESEKLYFYPIETYYPNTKLWITRYRFAEPWRFELRIRPHFLTKVQKRNWEAERRNDEIEDYLFKKKYFTKTEKTRKAYEWYLKDEWYRRSAMEDILRNKPLHEVMEEYNEEKQLWEYDLKN